MDNQVLNQILWCICLPSPIICAVIGSVIMHRKGRSAAAGLLLGWFLNVVGVAIALLLPHAPGSVNMPRGTTSDIRQRAGRIAGLLKGSYKYMESKDSLVRTSHRKFTDALKALEKEPGEVIEGCMFSLAEAYALASHDKKVEIFANGLSRGDRDAHRVFGILLRSLERDNWRDPKAYLHMHASVKHLAWLAESGNIQARRVIQRTLHSEDLYARVVLARIVQKNAPDLVDDAEVREIYRQCFKSRDRLLWQKAVEELWSVISGSGTRAEYYLDIDMLDPALSIISPESDAQTRTQLFTKTCTASLISWFYYSDLLSEQQKKLIDQRRSVVVDRDERKSTEISRGRYIDTPAGSGWYPHTEEVESTVYYNVTLGERLENSTYRPPE